MATTDQSESKPALGLLVAGLAGTLLGAAAAALLLRIFPGASRRKLDRASRERIEDRIAVIARWPVTPAPPAVRAAPTVLTPAGVSRSPGHTRVGVRHRLWRDASVALVILGTALLGVSAVFDARGPTGAVLEATATARPGSATVTEASPPTPVAGPADVPTTPAPVPPPSASSNPAATPVAPAIPAVEAVRTPNPTATGTNPTSASLAVLTPCPDRPDCYLYTVRRGDNLSRIARRFGVSLDSVLRLNPQVRDPGIIHPGETLALPPPTR